jgi:hypothetical protein
MGALFIITSVAFSHAWSDAGISAAPYSPPVPRSPPLPPPPLSLYNDATDDCRPNDGILPRLTSAFNRGVCWILHHVDVFGVFTRFHPLFCCVQKTENERGEFEGTPSVPGTGRGELSSAVKTLPHREASLWRRPQTIGRRAVERHAPILTVSAERFVSIYRAYRSNPPNHTGPIAHTLLSILYSPVGSRSISVTDIMLSIGEVFVQYMSEEFDALPTDYTTNMRIITRMFIRKILGATEDGAHARIDLETEFPTFSVELVQIWETTFRALLQGDRSIDLLEIKRRADELEKMADQNLQVRELVEAFVEVSFGITVTEGFRTQILRRLGDVYPTDFKPWRVDFAKKMRTFILNGLVVNSFYGLEGNFTDETPLNSYKFTQKDVRVTLTHAFTPTLSYIMNVVSMLLDKYDANEVNAVVTRANKTFSMLSDRVSTFYLEKKAVEITTAADGPGLFRDTVHELVKLICLPIDELFIEAKIDRYRTVTSSGSTVDVLEAFDEIIDFFESDYLDHLEGLPIGRLREMSDAASWSRSSELALLEKVSTTPTLRNVLTPVILGIWGSTVALVFNEFIGKSFWEDLWVTLRRNNLASLDDSVGEGIITGEGVGTEFAAGQVRPKLFQP